MALKRDRELKLYYSIKEVAQQIGVSEATLRFWEKEFPKIAPQKGDNKVRRYTKEDIERIRLVHHLVKEKGLTLKGAKKQLKDNSARLEEGLSVVERLKLVREELLQIRAEIDNL